MNKTAYSTIFKYLEAKLYVKVSDRAMRFYLLIILLRVKEVSRDKI